MTRKIAVIFAVDIAVSAAYPRGAATHFRVSGKGLVGRPVTSASKGPTRRKQAAVTQHQR